MNVASKELSEELWKLSGWRDTLYLYWNSKADYKISKDVADWGLENYPNTWPAYDADYVLSKVRDYDFSIINLNSKTVSLTSDSLEDPEAAIFGETLAETLVIFAIELFKQNVLKKETP